MPLILRNDDVTMSSNLDDILKMYAIIREKLPNAEIRSSVTVFSKGNQGHVYPIEPMKHMPLSYLYDVDRAWVNYPNLGDKIVSHGLFHIDHTKLSYSAMEMSIVCSCRYLHTSAFTPPYGYENDMMNTICKLHNIKLEHSYPLDGWKSIEFNKFDEKHENWYFHSWRFTPKTFEKALEGNI